MQPDLEAFQDGFLREAMLGGEGELSLDILGGVQLADLCGPPRKRRPGSPLGFPPLSPLGAANAQVSCAATESGPRVPS